MAESLATRSSRGHRTICLPITEETYRQIVDDPARFDARIDDELPTDARTVPAELRGIPTDGPPRLGQAGRPDPPHPP